MRHLADCVVVANDEVGPAQFRMRLKAPAIAADAQPGQFCMLEVAAGFYPFLRRPMCFERIDESEGAVDILYKVEGEGTALLARFIPGQLINVQGPLGQGFDMDLSFERHIIVAGGIGVATFPGFAEALVAAGANVLVLLAARTRNMILCEDFFRVLGCEVRVATDDGSAGEKMYASQLLASVAPGPGDRVYACGPMIMMKTVADAAAAAGANCHVSLEAQMACGDGACLGCVVESKLEKEGEKMVRVCLDGPVFDAGIIDWEAHSLASSH